jgi:hypothetical protein
MRAACNSTYISTFICLSRSLKVNSVIYCNYIIIHSIFTYITTNIYVDSLTEKRNIAINYTFVRWLLNPKYAKGRTQ